MYDKPKSRRARVRDLLASLPENCGVFPATELDRDESNGETRPVPIEVDDNGNLLLPYMQGAMD